MKHYTGAFGVIAYSRRKTNRKIKLAAAIGIVALLVILRYL
ncbi:MAG TPA: hypothetical protein VF790_01225 [Dissulfurispiraceae bacterium]